MTKSFKISSTMVVYENCRCRFPKIFGVIENTLSVSFDIKFFRRDQKQRRNGQALRASPTSFWSSLKNLISKDTYIVFYLSCMISRFNGKETAKKCKANAVLFELADVANALWCKLATSFTNQNVVITVNVSISKSS